MRETTFPYFIKVPKIINSIIKITIFQRDFNTDKRTDVCSRPLCSYSGIFSPKKNWFFWDKIFFQNFFWKILTLFYATFQCGRYNVKKIQKKFFFAHEKLKKPPKKVAQNRPRPLFPTNQPRPQPTAQNWFSISWNFGTRHLFSYLWISK